MAGCCATDYRKLFNRKFAARDALRYRDRGVTGTSQTLVELAGDVHGATVLDVGGGVGAIGLELLAAGAEKATNIELSDAYEGVAAELAAERHVSARIERRIGDIVDDGAAVGEHDVVVLHRVVCCYPDAEAMMSTAARLTRRRLVLTYPQERGLIRAGISVVNVFLRVRGCGFRVYAHPVARILGAAEREGLQLEERVRRGFLWESASLARGAI